MKGRKKNSLSLLEFLIKKNKEKKKEKLKFVEKYWKLSATERIDYDNKLKNIKEGTDYGYFPLTSIFITWIFLGLAAIYLFFYLSGRNIFWIIEGFKILIIIYYLAISGVVLDIFLMSISFHKRYKLIEKLKKRFKLI